MERFRILPVVLAIATIAAVCSLVEAQTDQDVPTPQPSHVRKAAKRPMPFPPGDETPRPAASLEFRSYERMSEQDRNLAADAESAIGERAGFAGLEFNQGKWNYQQIVCPVLPNHLFLQFTRNNGTGDMSMFSASIPRGGDGRVRIIPIVRRGYSLFSPAPINALTISAFNHIRAEEHQDADQDWLGNGLCYAALAGGHPVAAKLTEDSDNRKFPAAIPAALAVPVNGGEVISFTDVSASPKLMQWNMIFNRKGKLLKATHAPVGLLTVGAVPPSTGALPTRSVPPTIGDLPGEH